VVELVAGTVSVEHFASSTSYYEAVTVAESVVVSAG